MSFKMKSCNLQQLNYYWILRENQIKISTSRLSHLKALGSEYLRKQVFWRGFLGFQIFKDKKKPHFTKTNQS